MRLTRRKLQETMFTALMLVTNELGSKNNKR